MKAVKTSAGILLYRIRDKKPEIFLVHPGGPFWTNKDVGVWSIPKGEFNSDENPLEAAKREFKEETGTTLTGHFFALSPITQKAGKQVYAWAVEGDMDASSIQSNTFQVERPPKSGKWKSYPEVDKAAWFAPDVAKEKINPAQIVLIDELLQKLQKDD